MRRHRLSTDDQCATGICTLAGSQCTQNHGTDHPGRLLSLFGHDTRDVALRYVTQLMPEHRCQFIAAANHRQQPQMNTKISARQRKRIDRAVAPEHDLPGKALTQFTAKVATQARRRQQRLPDALHIVDQHRIVNVIRVTVDFARNPVTQSALDIAAHLAAIPQRRQLVAVGRTPLQRRQQRGRQNQSMNGDATHRVYGAFHDRMMRDSYKRRVNLALPAQRSNCNELTHELTYPF